MGLAVRDGGNDHLVFLENADAEIALEVRRTHDDSLERMGIGSRGSRDVGAVGIRERNLRRHSDYFWIFEVIELGLLCAIDAELLAGIECGKRIWGKKTDGLNVGAGLGRLQVEDVLVQELAKRVVVTLAEEISLAHGGVGKRRIEGRQRLNEQERRAGKRGGQTKKGAHAFLLEDKSNRATAPAYFLAREVLKAYSLLSG